MSNPAPLLRAINAKAQPPAGVGHSLIKSPLLQTEDLHLWLVQTDCPEHELPLWSSWLTSDERERANRFKIPQLAHRFIIRRAILRLLLGYYCECAPSSIHFSYNQYGKPCLPDSKIEFNASHSGPYSIIALTWDRQVGVDIEAVKPINDFMQVCAYYFSEREQAEICQLPENLRLLAFYNAWTRKEAFIKATGYGLFFGLKNFSVRATPGPPAALLSVDSPEHHAEHWCMENLHVPTGWRAAVTYRAPALRVTMRQLQKHFSIRSQGDPIS